MQFLKVVLKSRDVFCILVVNNASGKNGQVNQNQILPALTPDIFMQCMCGKCDHENDIGN